MLNLASLFAIRNPRLRENIRDFHERLAFLALDVATATPERWDSQVRQMVRAGVFDKPPDVPYEKVRQAVLEEGAYRVEVPTTRHTQVEFDVFDKVLPYFVERRWQLCIASEDSGGFVTSDHPVVLMWSDGSPSTMHRPVGFGRNGTTVIFPLTRDLLMVGVFDGSEGERNLKPLQVAYFNGLIAAYAERQVYAAGPKAQVTAERFDKPLKIADLPNYLALQQQQRSEPEYEPESDASYRAGGPS